MPDVSQAEESVHAFIVGSVQTAWDGSDEIQHKAMLLSSLGTKLKNAFGEYGTYFPKGLKEFLRTWPLVQLVQHPEIKEKIGLIPAGEPLPRDVATLFEKAGDKHVSKIPISYNQDFWNAFFKPIGSCRYVIVGENGLLQILDDVADVPDGAYEIAKSDIIAPDHATPTTEKIVATRERIDSWISKNSLEASLFFKKSAPTATNSHDKLIHLKRAFDKISDEDRKRVLIPLDIILKIIS